MKCLEGEAGELVMKLYIPKSFLRQAEKSQVSEESCKEAINKAEKGQIYADLGGGLIKQGIPRNNLSGARCARGIIFYRKGSVAVFLHLFPKSARDNLTKAELDQYLKLAETLERLTEAKLKELGETKGWKELEI
jgi:hypothetical protein